MNLDNILGALDVEPSKPRSAVHLKVVKIEDASPDFTTWDKMLELNPELDGSILVSSHGQRFKKWAQTK